MELLAKRRSLYPRGKVSSPVFDKMGRKELDPKSKLPVYMQVIILKYELISIEI